MPKRMTIRTFLLRTIAIALPICTGAALPTMARAEEALGALDRWGNNGTRLFRTCDFASAAAVAGFIEDLDRAVEFLNHHPDIVRDGTRLEISTTTYDTGSLTELDFALARDADRLLAARGASCQPQRLSEAAPRGANR